MVRKSERSAESYTGNTEEAKKRQRANLIPGNVWAKKHRKELRLNCWWWTISLIDMQYIYEVYVNDRLSYDVLKEELKSEDFLDDEWWEKLTIENKEYIVKWMRSVFGGDEEDHKKRQDKLLEEQIKEEKLADEKGGNNNEKNSQFSLQFSS